MNIDRALSRDREHGLRQNKPVCSHDHEIGAHTAYEIMYMP